MGWALQWCRQWSEVWASEIQPAWRRLLEDAGGSHVYHRPEMVRAWVETCGEALGAEAMVGIASDDAGHRLLLPWVIVPYAGRLVGRRVLEPAGRSFFGYHDPLVGGAGSDAIDWPGFWDVARRSVGGSCDQAMFRFVNARHCRGVSAERCADASPVLTLDGLADLEAVLARCSVNHRGDVRRRVRRLEEKGEVTVWVAGPDDTAVAVGDFRERFTPAYRELWRERPGGDPFLQPGFAQFAERLLSEGLAGGWAHYAVLRVAGSAVAWHLGLLHHRELYWWLPTYDAAWANLSPGKVLLAKLIEYAIARKWTRLHFLTGNQSYKLAWKPDLPELRTIRWRASGPRAAVLAWYDAVYRARHRAV